MVATALCKRPPTHTFQSLHYHFPSDPRPVKAVLQGSYRRSLRGLRFRGDDTNAPTFIFRCVLGESSYPLARRLLRAPSIKEIVRSQPPNKFLCPLPTSGPSRTASASVLQYNPFFAPQLLQKASVLPSLRRLGRRSDMLRLPCRRPHEVAHLFSYPIHATDLTPGGYVGGTPLDRSVLGGLPQFADLHPIQIDFDFFHSLPCFENKFTLSLFNCQLKLCKCLFCASIVFQIVILSFLLYIWDCHLFCQDCQFILQIVQSIQLNCHLVHLIVILCVALSHFCGDCSF